MAKTCSRERQGKSRRGGQRTRRMTADEWLRRLIDLTSGTTGYLHPDLHR